MVCRSSSVSRQHACGLPLMIEDSHGRTVWWASAVEPYGDIPRTAAAVGLDRGWPIRVASEYMPKALYGR